MRYFSHFAPVNLYMIAEREQHLDEYTFWNMYSFKVNNNHTVSFIPLKCLFLLCYAVRSSSQKIYFMINIKLIFGPKHFNAWLQYTCTYQWTNRLSVEPSKQTEAMNVLHKGIHNTHTHANIEFGLEQHVTIPKNTLLKPETMIAIVC